MDSATKIYQDKLDELVKRIVKEAKPLRILLFGSAAHGTLRPHSDLDVLVIMPDGIHRRQTAQKLIHSLAGIGVAKDIIVVTESDVREYADNPSLVMYTALREGKELYSATG